MSPEQIRQLQDNLQFSMLRDRHRLRRRLTNLKRGEVSSEAADWQKFHADLERSMALFQQRFDARPVPTYPDNLPIVSMREEIIDSIKAHQVVIICGETGSGKTTQLPKMCIEAGRGAGGFIGHTQPRRIAARSVASRIAEELGSSVGAAVGFKIRFSDNVGSDSIIKLMTDGILLAEIQNDPFLNQYDTIIVDEAHERSLNIDFLLGCLKRLLSKRRDLKVIITSATIDPQSFSRYFDDAPVLLAEGRSYPVEVRYQSDPEATGSGQDNSGDGLVDDADFDADGNAAIISACETLLGEKMGDILVFLSGEREIRDLSDALAKHARVSKRLRGAEVLPLFARLSNAEQNRIFQKHTRPRIVLATNVAETSLTVPGIRSVIDTGLARISRYSVRGKMQRLPIENISRASADQRKGRCGREAPGVCIRLYDEESFDSRPAFTEPEIVRTNLASVILQMAAMRLGSIEDFPLIEPPQTKFINDGYRTLAEIGAIDQKRKLLPLGRRIARLPIDPRLARMLLAAEEEGCVNELLTIVSALSVQDPRDRPFEQRQKADELHAEFNHETSDFMAWTALWSFISVQKQELSNSRFRKMCRQRFLSPVRLFEWIEVRRQLKVLLRSMKIRENSDDAEYDNIHRALLSGLLVNVAVKTDKHDYLGTRNRKLMIFPGSALFKSGPKWLVAAEISETTKVYARQVAKIDPRWLESLAEHLLQRSYRDPHWQRKNGYVGAYEQSTLYGLIVNAGKRVNYSAINATESREIFIRDALVAGNLKTRGKFLQHNQELLDEVSDLEDKSRRRDIVVDELELVRFYESIIPDEVVSAASFETWRRQYEEQFPRGLFFSRDLLLASEPDDISVNQFPERIEFEGVVLPLKYHFAPGEEDDGVTLVVPVELLNRVNPERCEWLVPGMLEEKIVFLIKALPKQLRRNFVPAPDFAAASSTALLDADSYISSAPPSLLQALSRELQRMSGVEISVRDWVLDTLPAHLQMRFEVIDDDAATLAAGRDLRALQKGFTDRVEEHLLSFHDAAIERDDVDDWNFGDLPESTEIEKNGVKMQGHPALHLNTHPDGERIAVKLFASPARAAMEMRVGLNALYRRLLREEIKYLSRKLPNIDMLSLRFTQYGGKEVLIKDIINASIEETFVVDLPFPRQRETFIQHLSERRGQLVPMAGEICQELAEVLEQYRLVSKRLDGSIPLSWVEAAADLKDQMSMLIYPGFVSATGLVQLKRLAIYFQAMQKRLDAIDLAPDKDRLRRAEVLPVWEQFKQLPATREDDPAYSDAHRALRWSFEELRISLFAQELGTAEKVSVPRLEKRLQKLIDS